MPEPTHEELFPNPRQHWVFWDTLKDRQLGINGYPSEPYAKLELEHFLARDRKGGRPDLHDIWPHVEIRRER